MSGRAGSVSGYIRLRGGDWEPTCVSHDPNVEICHLPGTDGDWSYKGWYKKPIDATILRTAKIFYQLGFHCCTEKYIRA